MDWQIIWYFKNDNLLITNPVEFERDPWKLIAKNTGKWKLFSIMTSINDARLKTIDDVIKFIEDKSTKFYVIPRFPFRAMSLT